MARKKKQAAIPGDPFKTWKEVQDHQYDPGYWTGGRVHPIYHAGRRNRYGWLLFASGIVTVAMGLRFVVNGGDDLMEGVISLVFGVVILAAWIRMMTHKKSRPKKPR